MRAGDPAATQLFAQDAPQLQGSTIADSMGPSPAHPSSKDERKLVVQGSARLLKEDGLELIPANRCCFPLLSVLQDQKQPAPPTCP